MSRAAGRDDAQLAQALASCLSGHGSALLAVSGGPDSTALLHAASALQGVGAIAVATVDHRLRPASAEDAAAVGGLARRLGLPHAILRWEAPRQTGIQAAARAERYRLLALHARSIGADTVLTAHTRDDQAETVLLRLLAGSGPAGLAGMSRERALGSGVRLVRPFLDLPKASLVAYCERHGLPIAQDPSNTDHRFARARLRVLVPALAAEGLGIDRLCRLAQRLARDDAALGSAAADAFRDARVGSMPGTLSLDGACLARLPEAVALRLVDLALETLQPGLSSPVPRRLERLEHLVLGALLPALASGTTLRRTLRGIVIEAAPSGLIRMVPAPARRGARVAGGSRVGVHHAAGAGDLLGNAEGAAYIGPERPE